nr:hypothetical protein [uncultured Capnocytophaga sp.]
MKEEIILSSDCDYENLVAEIYLDDKFIALVSYDENNTFFVETPSNNFKEEFITHKIDLDIFIKLLKEAKEALT